MLEDRHGGYIIGPDGITALADRKARKLRKKMKQDAKTKRLETKLSRKQERQESRTEGMRGRRAVQQSRLSKRLTRNVEREKSFIQPEYEPQTSADTDYFEPEYEVLPNEAEMLPEYEEQPEMYANESEIIYDDQGLSAGIFGSIAKGALQVGKSLLTPTVQSTVKSTVPTITRAEYEVALKRAGDAENKAAELEKQKVFYGIGGAAAGFALGYFFSK